MQRFFGRYSRQKHRLLSNFRKTGTRRLLSVFLPSLSSGRAPSHRTLRKITLGLWLLIIAGTYSYQPLLHNLSSLSRKCSSVSCREREAANIRCSSSKTMVEIPTHPLALFDCLNASKSGFREGLTCKTSTRKPFLLWTIPGAGNTWIRNLLEQATGVATGSVYNDSSLRKIFIGEGLCDDTTLCIKAHPSTHPFELISNQADDFTLSSPILAFRNSVTRSASDALRRHVGFKSHCRHKSDAHTSGESLLFSRALIVDRNPLEAAFAEVQRLTIKRQGGGEGSHVNHLRKNFKHEVNERVWNRLCADYLRLGIDYVLAWHSYVQFEQKFGKDAMYVARYEDLKDTQKRENVLREMLDFLDAELLTGSLECAFARSKDARILRASKKSSETNSNSKENGSSSSPHLSLTDFLFSDFMGKPLIAWMWTIIGRVAEARGYTLPKGFMLSEHQNRNGTLNMDIKRAIGFPHNKWYDDKDKMDSLHTLGFDSSAEFNLKSEGERVISREYIPCLEKASLVKRDGHVVLTFIGNPAGVGIDDKRSAFPILLNSLLWMRAAGVQEVLVVCFDEEYEYVLRSLGVATCFLELTSQRDGDGQRSGKDSKTDVISEVYHRRLAVIEALLHADIDVVHTDIDAVWTGNALQVLRDYHNKDDRRRDIVASRGTFPYRESVSWGGSTLCMGLISFRATAGVRQIVRTARQTASKYRDDDQIGLNRGLAQLGVVWHGKGQEVGEVVLPGISSMCTIGVALLPESMVRRNCTSNDRADSLIMHCFDKQRASFSDISTKGFMQQRGLWLLKEEWLETMISQEHENVSIETLGVRSQQIGLAKVG